MSTNSPLFSSSSPPPSSWDCLGDLDDDPDISELLLWAWLLHSGLSGLGNSSSDLCKEWLEGFGEVECIGMEEADGVDRLVKDPDPSIGFSGKLPFLSFEGISPSSVLMQPVSTEFLTNDISIDPVASSSWSRTLGHRVQERMKSARGEPSRLRRWRVWVRNTETRDAKTR